MPLRATLVLRNRFDAEDCLRTIAERCCTALFAVPIMLQRILNLPASVRARYDTSSLRIVASSGSALAGALVTDFLDAFGDVLYNFYGSTEVSWATVADPGDLRAAPTTAGRPPLGTTVGLFGTTGDPAPPGHGRPDLRRQRHAVRRLHRRRGQGHTGLHDGHRRPRLLRRRRPAVCDRPERRDDHFRWGERVPAPGRGGAGRTATGSRRRPWWGCPTPSTASGSPPTSCSARARRHRLGAPERVGQRRREAVQLGALRLLALRVGRRSGDQERGRAGHHGDNGQCASSGHGCRRI